MVASPLLTTPSWSVIHIGEAHAGAISFAGIVARVAAAASPLVSPSGTPIPAQQYVSTGRRLLVAPVVLKCYPLHVSDTGEVNRDLARPGGSGSRAGGCRSAASDGCR